MSFVGLADISGDRTEEQLSTYPEHKYIAAPDLEGAMAGLSAELGVPIGPDDGVATVVLSHTPVGFQANADAGADVMMSGHTHGGHVFPFHMFLFFYDGSSGLFEKMASGAGGAASRAFLYVSEGVVGWGPRVRLFSRPEVTIVTLLSDESGSADPTGDVGLRMGHAFVYVALATVPASILFCIVLGVQDARRKRKEKAEGKDSR